ncbi:transglycosylase SLT domain-containing protein [Bradyrhizobium nitroreducens]|uniref:transglycosylase SLT domain-containing protein n=1 Tax=Bradyrhizobium nitroreducens TaxID=709803 RepID=UPI000C1E722F|nr:transglycosylase SLT domain-containing protein [Bradyrhizobium nitroreducens]
MAPPVKPAAPAITARTADSLTADWPAVADVGYIVRARDAAGLVREISIAVAPAKIDGLAANEQYSVTLEARNVDGGSGESTATVDWTAPPEPQAVPAVYASLRDGIVSVGWDLTAELATLRHPDTVAIEVGRSDAANFLVRLVGRGKIRDLLLDWQAPVGLLQYRLRLRAERPPPDAASVSSWGPAVAVVKPMPAGSSQHAPLQLDGMNRPTLGGLSSRALALAEEEEGGDEGGDGDDEGNEGDDNSNSNGNSNGGGNNSAGPSPGGDPQTSPSDNDGDENRGRDGASGRPSDSDPVDGRAVRNAVEINDTGSGPIARVELMGGYEVRKTSEGVWERHVENDGRGKYHAIGGWEFRGSDSSESDRSGGGPEREPGSTSFARVQDIMPKSESVDHASDGGAAALPDEAAARDSGSDTGRSRIETWETGDRFSRSDRNSGMTLRSDRGDARRAGPDDVAPERPRAPAKAGSAKSKSSRGRSVAPSLTDRFMNLLRGVWGTRSAVQGPAARSSRGGRLGKLATGSAETNAAIREAANRYGFDVSFMQAVASIESSMDPKVVNRLGYSGLYQFGKPAWKDFGQGGDRRDARDSAMAAARMFDKNRQRLEKKFGRAPTPTELYIAHQQGAGFYTQGANSKFMQGNPYPGMRGEQTAQSFEAGWGAEIERRMRYFESLSRGAPDQSLAPDNRGASQETMQSLYPEGSGQPVRLP